jgi:hypothetical protein
MQTQRKVHVRAYKTTGHIGRKIQHAADIQARIQLLDAELKELRTEFLAHMEATGLDRMEVGDFRITRKVRHCSHAARALHNYAVHGSPWRRILPRPGPGMVCSRSRQSPPN